MVILATRIYGDHTRRAMQSLEAMLDGHLGGLEVAYEVGLRHDGFPSVTVTGEDATAARNLLAAEFGQLPGRLEPDTTYRGVLVDWTEEGFVINAGEEVLLPGDALGLGPGEPDQVATRFGLVRNLPVDFVTDQPPSLADTERDRLFGWRRGPGRVTANGVTRGQLRATINRAGHAQDIETIDRLGILEQSIICRDDTDPPGLVASIGPYVPGELACVLP